jgi:hypothetical protein
MLRRAAVSGRIPVDSCGGAQLTPTRNARIATREQAEMLYVGPILLGPARPGGL